MQIATHPYTMDVPAYMLADFFYDRGDNATGDAVLKMKRADQLSGGVEAAKNVRIMLKSHFPQFKFSVKSTYSAINIKWKNGPTKQQVDDVVGIFKEGVSSYCGDYVDYVSNEWTRIFGGSKYVFCSREVDDTQEDMAWQKQFPFGLNSQGVFYGTYKEAVRGSNSANNFAYRTVQGTSFHPNGMIDEQQEL